MGQDPTPRLPLRSLAAARTALFCAALVGSSLGSGPTYAQDLGGSTNTENNLNISHYRPPASPDGYLTVPRSRGQTWREWSVGLHLNYARNPLVLFQDRLQVAEVVAHRIDADLVASVGLLNWLDVYLMLPLTFYQGGDEGGPTGTLATIGLRDLRLGVRFTLLKQERFKFFGLALVPEISLPTGPSNDFLGEGFPNFNPYLVLDRWFDVLFGLRAAVMVGIRLRPRTELGNIEVANELFYRLAAGVGLPPVGPLEPEAVAELVGTTGLSAPFQETEQNPLITNLGLRVPIEVDHGHQLVTNGGIAFGLSRGYGAPDFQVFLGVSYRRYLKDRGKDGIPDVDDFCPDDPEDFDNFEDADGCPEPDNDKDGLPDVSDQCPNEPEDLDGFEDMDGCPDPDNDKDGIPDVKDQCPNEPEDLDGFEDEDGCPELDNDKDGIPDHLDQCPDQKETINGEADEDGCPDEGEAHVEVTSEKITIDTRIQFAFDSDRIEAESFSILNQVGLTMLANPQLAKIRVEGHTDERGSDIYNLELSQRRAESVVRYLVGRGVPAARLEAVGYGETKPIINKSTEEAWATNRRVEFTILDQGTAPESGTQPLQMPTDGTAPPPKP